MRHETDRARVAEVPATGPSRLAWAVAAAAWTAAGCGSTEPADEGEGEADAAADVAADVTNCEARDEVVHFTTDDDVTLEADLRSTSQAVGPAVVLLHMIPPANDRTNYPAEFLDALFAQGLTVLNVDRRGAAGSGGNAIDAYQGPLGVLDAKAAVDFLSRLACAPDPVRVGLVGASNGTTTVFDYALLAAGSGCPGPAAVVFLTGGTYTENNNTMADNRATVDPIPILFEFASDEAEWSSQFESGAPSTWSFDERDVAPQNGHGTNMFQADPSSIDFAASFLGKTL